MSSDAELVRQALAGQAAAYEDLVRRWSARVHAVCHAKVGRTGAAEDLAQETLLRGYRSLHSLEEPDKFGAWLYGIALRACKDWLKAKERSQVTFSDLSADRDPAGILCSQPRNDEPELDRQDERRRVVAEVDSLPEEYRIVLMLFYYQELKYRDIAQMLGVSAATVNARLTKARAMLRERLTRCER
jgi:RNA polymerase sigma-70 factor (ECF subfamily)